MATRNVSNLEDVLDSRDIIARIEELEAERDEAKVSTIRENNGDIDESTIWTAQDGTEFTEAWDGEDEYKALTALAEEGEGSPDWKHGETLIRDSYFREYAQELAEDIGAIDKNAYWPNTCIDWDQAARELQYDYFSVDFDGVTYWVRS